MNTRQRRSLRTTLRLMAATAVTLFFLFPIYWLFMISFKTAEEIFAYPPKWWPDHIAEVKFGNYLLCSRTGTPLPCGTAW